ncbi:MAG: Rnf-Nqr domain containing protein [Chitinispirillaceae bacterium]|jgi:electron transport complex protein RnfE
MRDELKKCLLCTVPAPLIGVGLVAPLCACGSLRADVLLGTVAAASLVVTGAAMAVAVGPRFQANVRIGLSVLVAGGILTIAKIIAAIFQQGGSVQVETLAPLMFSAAIIAADTEAYAVKKKALAVLFDGLGIGLLFTLLLSACGILRSTAAGSGVFSFFTGSTPGVFFATAIISLGIAYMRQRTAKRAS